MNSKNNILQDNYKNSEHVKQLFLCVVQSSPPGCSVLHGDDLIARREKEGLSSTHHGRQTNGWLKSAHNCV